MAGQAYGVSNVAVEVGSARWLVAGAANPFGKMDCGAVRRIRLAKWTAVRCGKSVRQNGLRCGAANPFGKTDSGAVRRIRLAKMDCCAPRRTPKQRQPAHGRWRQ